MDEYLMDYFDSKKQSVHIRNEYLYATDYGKLADKLDPYHAKQQVFENWKDGGCAWA